MSYMDIKRAIISIDMQATNPTTISAWTGSMLRGAIKSAIAYENCKSLRYGDCNRCKHMDCPNKLLFDRKEQGNAKVQANLVVINSDFLESPKVTDKFSFQIELYGDSGAEIRLLTDALTHGVYMGEPRVKWQATNFTVNTDKIELPDFRDQHEKDGHCKIVIKTPIVSKHMVNFDIMKFIQMCTLRITGIVNSAGIDYHVPFVELKDAAKDSKLTNIKLASNKYRRKSSVKNRIDNVTGVCGEFEIVGNVATLIPFINIASQLGIGKECTMSLGKFNVE